MQEFDYLMLLLCMADIRNFSVSILDSSEHPRSLTSMFLFQGGGGEDRKKRCNAMFDSSPKRVMSIYESVDNDIDGFGEGNGFYRAFVVTTDPLNPRT